MNFEELLAEGDQQQPWEGRPANTILGHIHLFVSELKETEMFYNEGLGFEVVGRYGDQALFISTGKYHHHIALNTWMGVGAPAASVNSVGLESFTIILEDDKKRNKVINQLENMGASVNEEHASYVTVDPSGNRILLEVQPHSAKV